MVLRHGEDRMGDRATLAKDDFRAEIRSQIRRAEASGAAHIEINSGEVHRKLGGYPGTNHRMPVCCDAMYEERRNSDPVIAAPAKRKGASLNSIHAAKVSVLLSV